MKIHRFYLILLTCLFAGSLCVYGQGQVYRLQSNRIWSAGGSVEYWKAGEDQITALSIPVSFIFPYGDKARFYLMTSPAFSHLNTGQSYRLEGMSDVKLGGHVLAFNDKWLLTFGLNAPTGKHALKGEEFTVASVLTLEAFDFRVPSLGQGFDAQVGLSTAGQVGNMVLGGGVSFLLKGGFKPYFDYESSYNPGDEVTITLGCGFGSTSIDVLYTIYTDDTWEDEKVFRSGNKLTLQLMSNFKLGAMDAVLFMRERIKGKNKSGTGLLFDTEPKNSNVNLFETQFYGYRPLKSGSRFKTVLDLKILSNNDYDYGGATLFGFGGGWLFRLSQRTVFDLELRYYLGKIQTGAGKVDASGVKGFGGFQITM